jgi:glycosyltransferase involved in cell wall biosynthesis
MFSVVICTYIHDNPKLLELALKSIHNQHLLPFEVILVKDGPVNDEADIIISNFEADLKRKQIIFKLQAFSENIGHGNARRSGIEITSCEFIAICDADDINLPNRFSTQFNYLKDNMNISVVGSNIHEFTDNKLVAARLVPSESEDIKKFCRFRCPINQMTVMFKKKDIMDVGGYKDFYHNEDYFLWIRLINAGYQLANIPEILVHANVDSQTYKRRGGYRYFQSELTIQILLLRSNVTNVTIFVLNVAIRIFIQLLMPGSLRQILFKKFFRNRS